MPQHSLFTNIAWSVLSKLTANFNPQVLNTVQYTVSLTDRGRNNKLMCVYRVSVTFSYIKSIVSVFYSNQKYLPGIHSSTIYSNTHLVLSLLLVIHILLLLVLFLAMPGNTSSNTRSDSTGTITNNIALLPPLPLA